MHRQSGREMREKLLAAVQFQRAVRMRDKERKHLDPTLITQKAVQRRHPGRAAVDDLLSENSITTLERGGADSCNNPSKLQEAHPGKGEIVSGVHQSGSGGGIRPDPDSAKSDPGQHGRIQTRARTAQVSESEGNCDENHRGNC